MSDNNFKDIYKWSVIENISTIIVVGLLFWLTKSWLCFLLLLNLSTVRYKD